jgi:hypothetical protein
VDIDEPQDDGFSCTNKNSIIPPPILERFPKAVMQTVAENHGSSIRLANDSWGFILLDSACFDNVSSVTLVTLKCNNVMNDFTTL